MPKDKFLVGDLINFRGLVYSPMNENGVIFLFGRVIDDLHMYIEEIKPGFPDCVARRFTGKGWERVTIEFEFNSSNFKTHDHNPDDCDLIVCWEHDWKDCPIEVIELQLEIEAMNNWPIKHPSTSIEPGPKGEQALQELFSTHQVQPNIQEWYPKSKRLCANGMRRSGPISAKSILGFTHPKSRSRPSSQDQHLYELSASAEASRFQAQR